MDIININIKMSDVNNVDVTKRLNLLSLDTDAYNLILVQYLNFIDYAALDIAYCNHIHRDKLFEVYTSISIKEMNLSDFNHSVDDILIWIGKRGMNIQNISSCRVHFSNQGTHTNYTSLFTYS